MLEIGESLSGRYRIERILGKGGMGAVYLGVMDSLGGKRFAIKEMEFSGQGHRTQEQAVEQFRKEASFLANLDHPNLVQVTDFFAEGDKHYLVMAYVEGQTLQERIEELQAPLPWAELKPRMEALLNVLEYLHTQNPPIIFRDLKPSNVMIEASGQLKLIDFGIARTAQPGQETSTFLKGTGTSGFSPIEQYGMGESTDQRSDIYAFGATIYYLTTGKVPPDAVHRVSSGKPLKPASAWNPSLPPYLDGILARCLGVRQNQRYNNIGEIKRELKLVQDAEISLETIDLALYSDNQGITPSSEPSPYSTLVSTLICLVFIFGVGFFWEDILGAFQPIQVVAQVESEEDSALSPEPEIREEVEEEPEPAEKPRRRDPYAYIPELPPTPPPAPVAKPRPVTKPTARPIARPKPRTEPAKPKLDLGRGNYPKAPPRSTASTPSQMPGEPTFYEKLPNGQKVVLKPDDPRIPLLRRQWRQRMEQQK